MSTEAEQPTVAPVTDKPIVADENGTAIAVSEPVAETTTETTATQNGDSKKEKKNGATKKEKEPEVPKDPKTETQEWLNQQHKKVIHKANYHLVKWTINESYAEDDAAKPVLPKSGLVTRREFMNNYKDGDILARLANHLKPGTIESVKEGEDAKVKENQKLNIDGFIAFAKEHLPEEQVFSYEDLEKGKEGFPKVFVTLFQLMLQASEAFQRPGVDFEQLFKELSEIVPKKFWQKFLGNLNNFGTVVNSFVRRSLSRSASNGQVTEAAQPDQNGAITNGVHTNGTTVEHEENGAPNGTPNGTKVEEKKEEAPAITAN